MTLAEAFRTYEKQIYDHIDEAPYYEGPDGGAAWQAHNKLWPQYDLPEPISATVIKSFPDGKVIFVKDDSCDSIESTLIVHTKVIMVRCTTPTTAKEDEVVQLTGYFGLGSSGSLEIFGEVQ